MVEIYSLSRFGTMPIQQALSLRRFQQIKRFLKLNNGRTEPSGMGK